jgi:hypothetical protein
MVGNGRGLVGSVAAGGKSLLSQPPGFRNGKAHGR